MGWQDAVVDYRDYKDNPAFLEYCKEELENNVRNPLAHSGRVRSPEEIREMTMIGKSVEWYLIHNTPLVKMIPEYIGIVNPKFDKVLLRKYMRYQDLIDPTTGRMIEVKCWRGHYAHAPDTEGERKLKAALGKWLFCDAVLVYEILPNNRCKFARKIPL